MRFLRFLPALMLLFCLAVPLRADSFDEEVGSMVLLQEKPVQKEIGLTAEQRSRMNVFADAHRAKLNAYYAELYKEHKQLDASGQKKLLDWFAELKKQVFAVLRPDQLKRLREISLQALGFPALADETVGARVGLSAAQESKVRSILNAASSEAAALREKAIKNSTADLENQKPTTTAAKKALYNEATKRAEAAVKKITPQVDRIRMRARTEIMAVLTSAERAKWQDLQGKPFNP